MKLENKNHNSLPQEERSDQSVIHNSRSEQELLCCNTSCRIFLARPQMILLTNLGQVSFPD
jgi:hypothetical protein